MKPHSAPSFDLYCRVVDNFGDAGVCWRLARQLAVERGCRVRLFIDRPATLALLLDRRSGSPVRRASGTATIVDTVRIADWPPDDSSAQGPDGDSSARDPAAVVIAAFGCELPPALRRSMGEHSARRPDVPVWINLEHLSAEAWVEGTHGLRSIKPADGAVEHFFFPGFTPRTGGLLRERELIAGRDRFRSTGARNHWLSAHGVSTRGEDTLISLFCYDAPSPAGWLARLAHGAHPVHLLVPAGIADAAIAACFDPAPTIGATSERGRLRLTRLPWLSQSEYDRLLWACDLNLVRGEDSWVRAHWAGRPLIWQPYPQRDDVHLRKLDAYLDLLSAGASARQKVLLSATMRAWSGAGDLADAWPQFIDSIRLADDDATPGNKPPAGSMRSLYRDFSARLAALPDLASTLIEFAQRRPIG